MLKAKDIMTKEVVGVKEEAPIYEAIEMLAKNEIAGIPVIEDDMTLVGIVTEKDVLRLFYADEQEKNKTVKDFMTRPAVYFDEDESLSDVCKCLINNDFRRVPVTSKGKVVGIISRPDVLKHILKITRDSAGTN